VLLRHGDEKGLVEEEFIMKGTGYLRRVRQGAPLDEAAHADEVTGREDGLHSVVAPGCAHPDPTRHLSPARLRLTEGAGRRDQE